MSELQDARENYITRSIISVGVTGRLKILQYKELRDERSYR
jgi:hypothetical protein